MNFSVTISYNASTLTIEEEYIAINEQDTQRQILYENILRLENGSGGRRTSRLYYIQDYPFPDYRLTKEYVDIGADEETHIQLQKSLSEKIKIATARPRKLSVFVNPIGGQRRGKQICDHVVVPIFTLAGIEVDVTVSERSGHGKEFAETYDFKSVDGLVILGGDGTISEIFNSLMRKTQSDAGVYLNDHNTTLQKMELPIGIIPAGTGNGLVSILHGCKDVMTSTLHIVKGRKKCCNVTGSYNDGDLIGYGVFIAAYGLFVDLADDVHRFRWLKIFRIIAVPFYYMFLKKLREINVDITYESLDGILHHSKEDNIDCQGKQKKRLINLLALSYDLDFEDYHKDKQPEKKDQFDLLDYTPCSRFDLMKHFYNLLHLTKEHLDSVNFISHNKVKAFNLEVTDDKNPSEQEQNLRYNIDGEIYNIKTPNLYVKLHPRCYNVYSSYTGPLRWS
ncbi:ceramide kinase-like [Mytilus trossulus]|uniref:ceramide kinase-like n=1 Tax=Mytilus trossulus TaxID=6551 RepID=UPI003003E088